MASNSNGSQVATVTTEHTLATISADGTFVLAVDVNALANDDTLELRVKLKVRSVGTTRLAYIATFKHAQTELVKISIPVASTNEIVFTLKQTTGTSRTFPWEIWEL